ncbi:MAG: B12-binding domain-containing radical SAM protein [Spirochaetota bacterium]|nr:B12-binding domain-containing radical SAM protein [Spirochaetota bacterium]
MKIELIEPLSKKKKAWRRVPLTPTSILQIAGLTPPEIELSITDEKYDQVDFDKKVDLVGISARTTCVSRAYEIADEYRKRGVKVVLGGMHPTILPDEAIQHADAVVVGEAENVWHNVIKDAQNDSLRSFYQSDDYSDMKGLPYPRRDLLDQNRYTEVYSLQFSRGCPYKCNFCTVSRFYGGKYRFRPVEDVISEIKQVDTKYIFFIDDNIAGNQRYAKELLNAIIPLKKKWVGQITITAAKNKDFVKLMADSGCISIFVGFESLSEQSLKESSKNHNKIEHYEKAIANLQNHGIFPVAAFVFGFDNDDKYIFEKTADFGYKNKVGFMNFNILTPYPGTDLYHELNKENRLHSKDWWLNNDWSDVLYEPKLMTSDELLNGCNLLHKEFSRYSSLARRFVFPDHNMMIYWFLYLRFNLSARKMIKDY